MNKEAVKETINALIANSKKPEEWLYVEGFIDGVLKAGAITPAEAEQFKYRLRSRITF